MMRDVLRILLIWAATTLPAGAEQSVSSGDIVVHYSAMTTADLTPDVASALNVSRSRKRALVVIHAQHVDGAQRQSRAATVRGTSKNLVGQSRELEFRSVRDGDAEYAIATRPVANLETLVFELVVDVEGHPSSLPIRFRQQFYH